MEKKTALITGAGSGLGSGIARVLARSGYDVAIHTGTNVERARALAESLAAECGVRAEVFSADFSQAGGAQRLFAQFRERFERLDLFVNNAGITKGGPVLQMTEETFDLVHNVNWKNAYFSVQQAASIMVETKTAGNMVIISSNNHAMNWYGASVYATVKEALVKFTRHAAMEFAQYGIRVNCIAPGFIKTQLTTRYTQEQVDAFVRKIPSGILGRPEDIVPMALLLADEEKARFIVGHTFVIDGGQSIDGAIDSMMYDF